MSDDTSDIEAMLSQYRPAGPDAVVRERVVRQAGRRSRWAFAEAMAALLLIGMTLGQIGGSVTEVIPRPGVEEGRVQQLASAIGQLELPLSDEEAYVMARQLSAGERLVQLPVVHGSGLTNAGMGVMP